MQVKWNHNSIEKLQLPQAFSTLFFILSIFLRESSTLEIHSLQTEKKHLDGLSFIRKKIQINILDVQQ